MKDIVVSVASSEVSLVDGSASMTVSVQNQTAAPERIVLSTVVATTPAAGTPPDGGGLAITIERALREIQAGTMEQYLVTLARGDAEPGHYDLKFIASPSEEATEEYAERAGRLTVVVPAPKEKPAPKFRWWPIAAAAVAILIVIGVITFLLIRPDSVAVPDVLSRTQAEAQSTLTSEGLRASVTTTPGIKPLGVVLSQDPGGGTEVKEGTKVTIVVGSPVSPPDVTSLTAAVAQGKLSALGFTTVTVVDQASSTAPGTVIRQDPPPQTPIALDDKITLTVAASTFVEVPNVVTLQVRAAFAALQSAGLNPEQTGICSLRLCTVRSQLPPAGKIVKRGSTVSLSVGPRIG